MKQRQKTAVYLLFPLILISAITAWINWGNTAVQITRYVIGSERIPEEFCGYQIVQVSDLHNKAFGERQNHLIAKIEELAPDLIAVTGDLIDARRPDIKTALDFAVKAAQIAPVYFVTGNHEAWFAAYDALKEQLNAAGIHLLDGKAVEIAHGGATVCLLGIADPAFQEASVYHGNQETVDQAIKSLSYDPSKYTILLSHRPELLQTYAENQIDLVLAGHAHGGQFRIPFAGGLFAPDQGLFPKYTAGVLAEGSTKLVVSRGLGNSSFPFRINNRPELVSVTLQRKG